MSFSVHVSYMMSISGVFRLRHRQKIVVDTIMTHSSERMLEIAKEVKPLHNLHYHCLCGICGQQRPRSACAFTVKLGPSLSANIIIGCMNGEQRSRWYFAHAQDNVNLRILCMLEGTFLLDVA